MRCSLTPGARVDDELALCPTCHGSFDKFLCTSRAPARVTVADVARWNRNTPAPLQALEGRDILAPTDPFLRPNHDALTWHRTLALA